MLRKRVFISIALIIICGLIMLVLWAYRIGGDSFLKALVFSLCGTTIAAIVMIWKWNINIKIEVKDERKV